MMRLKLTRLSIMLVVAAGTCTSASAASGAVFTLTTEKCTGGTFINLCYETVGKEKLELSGEQTIQFASTTVEVFKIPVLGVEVKCAKTTGMGTDAQLHPLSEKGSYKEAAFLFKECKVEGALGKKCQVPTEKETLPLTGSLESESELELRPKSGTVFIEFPFSNTGTETCPSTLKGTRKISGFQVVKVLEPGVAQETKKGEVVAKSGLKFSEEAAELTGTLEVEFVELKDKVYISTVA